MQRALEAYGNHRPGEAAAALRAWCDGRPEDPARWLDASRIAVAHRDFAGGTPFATRCRELRPDLAESWNLLGACLLLGGRPVDAEKVFREATRRFPEDAEMHFQLGMALSTNQRFLEALETFERARSLAPDHPAVPFWEAENHARLDHLEEAESLFRQARRAPDVNPDATWKLAEVLARQGRDDEAESLFRRADTEGPALARLRATFHHAVFLMERRRDREALPLLVRVTRDWPEHRVAWSYRARCEHRLGKEEAAGRSLQAFRSLQRREDAEETAMLLSQIEGLQGRLR